MTSLSPVTQLVSVIRSQLGSTAPVRQRRAGRANAARGAAADDLAGLIELRVAQIAPDDPQRGRKAFRVFLEAVLLAHFGPRVANDARFHQMLDDIQQAMEGDPASSKLVEQAVAHLLAR
ncbi:MAG TPA: hypothetical protein VGD52_20140 [Pseudoduganella sp.]